MRKQWERICAFCIETLLAVTGTNHFPGLAAGTLIYIVMFEVLQRERCRDVSGLLQLAAILAGFLVLVIIEVFGGCQTFMIIVMTLTMMMQVAMITPIMTITVNMTIMMTMMIMTNTDEHSDRFRRPGNRTSSMARLVWQRQTKAGNQECYK